MRTYIIVGVALLVMPFAVVHGATDYYLKIDGVEGESKTSASTGAGASVTGTTETTRTTPISGDPDFDLLRTTKATTTEAGGTDALLEIDTIKGESSGEGRGNAETEYKVEEGKSARPGVEPDEIDYDEDGQPIMPDFGILLGGGYIDRDDDGDTVPSKEEGLDRALQVLSENAKASDNAIESVTRNQEKITTRVRKEVKFFGVIPIEVLAEVDIDGEENVEVHFPWWTIFATGKDTEELGERIFTTLSNVLKTKHDTIKNSIGNIR